MQHAAHKCAHASDIHIELIASKAEKKERTAMKCILISALIFIQKH